MWTNRIGKDRSGQSFRLLQRLLQDFETELRRRFVAISNAKVYMNQGMLNRPCLFILGIFILPKILFSLLSFCPDNGSRYPNDLSDLKEFKLL